MPKSFVIAAIALTIVAAGASAAADRPPADAPERSSDASGKMICKRFARTGSLVATDRTCKTKWEWERERDNLRQLNVSSSCRDVANGGGLCRI